MKGEVRRVAGANRKIGLLVLRMWKKTVTWQPKGKCKESSTKKKKGFRNKCRGDFGIYISLRMAVAICVAGAEIRGSQGS